MKVFDYTNHTPKRKAGDKVRDTAGKVVYTVRRRKTPAYKKAGPVRHVSIN